MPGRHVPLIAACLVAFGAAGLPRAEENVADEVTTSLAGDWLLAPEDGQPGCHVILGTETTIGGYVITTTPECAGALPRIAEDAAAWRLGEGGLVLSDATRNAIVSFIETEWGTYVSTGDGGPRLLLTKAPAGVNAVPMAQDLFGAWNLKEAKTASLLCKLTLADAPPPGGEESFALETDADCDERIARLKLVSWRIEEIALALYGSDGDSLRLQLDGAGGWRSEDGTLALTR